jgi:hypothetical protein
MAVQRCDGKCDGDGEGDGVGSSCEDCRPQLGLSPWLCGPGLRESSMLPVVLS